MSKRALLPPLLCEPLTTKDDVDIFYKDWGPKDAPVIFFHHGRPLSADDWDDFLKSEIDRVSVLPGVQSVGIADMLPLDRNREWGLVSVGRYHAKDADTGALVYLVTPGYLQAIGMRLREGRDFSWNDTPDNQPVIIINEAGARREWPGENPVGKLAYGAGNKPSRVIGVIADVRESALEQNGCVATFRAAGW
jgi:hypothetical protein